MSKRSFLSVVLIENSIKNILVIIINLAFIPIINKSLNVLSKEQISDFLMTINILLVTVCFANFAFTYKSKIANRFSNRFFGHITTFVFMLLMALLLIVLVISIGRVYSSLSLISSLFSVLLYLGVVLYDYWDLLRAIE